MQVTIENGKYTVLTDENGGGLRALRYGEEWRDLCGDNLVYCLASEVESLRAESNQWQDGYFKVLEQNTVLRDALLKENCKCILDSVVYGEGITCQRCLALKEVGK